MTETAGAGPEEKVYAVGFADHVLAVIYKYKAQLGKQPDLNGLSGMRERRRKMYRVLIVDDEPIICEGLSI